MSKKANKAIIGGFVVGAIVLFIIGIVVFGSGVLFKHADKYVLFFNGSIKGLSVGAPVIFRGVKVGSVKNISLVYDEQAKEVVIPVIIEVELSGIKGAPKKAIVGHPRYEKLIQEGLRARLEIQSFITGQLMLSFDFYPDKPARLRGIMKEYLELPTLPISPDIFEIMDEVPVKDIADNLAKTVAGLNKIIDSGELQESLYELKSSLRETTEAARSLRLFLEYTEQHPEAFLKGKQIPKGE
ncbi:MAG: MlaD family protein [Candidatus Omnitrophica bacterium]|nr:MlaD family protein [Candidatus Omnitrophota bacterium]